jgi:hypothetical protein
VHFTRCVIGVPPWFHLASTTEHWCDRVAVPEFIDAVLDNMPRAARDRCSRLALAERTYSGVVCVTCHSSVEPQVSVLKSPTSLTNCQQFMTKISQPAGLYSAAITRSVCSARVTRHRRRRPLTGPFSAPLRFSETVSTACACAGREARNAFGRTKFTVSFSSKHRPSAARHATDTS